MTITWKKPEITGRDDFYYIIKYTDVANSESNFTIDPRVVRYTSNNETVSVHIPSSESGLSLEPNTDYIIKVIVHNGVSDQEPDNEPLRRKDISFRTKEGG